MGERAGAQPHFIGLCALLDVAAPDDAENYTFEKGTLKLGQKRGFADVFKRGCSAWEYKAPGGDLSGALRQLKDYANALDNPPLLIVSDRLAFEIHTQFTGRPTETFRFALKDFGKPEARELLHARLLRPQVFSRNAPAATLPNKPRKPLPMSPSACATSAANRPNVLRIF
jgi:hypothetical protein